jgi:Ser/Thr protein kinase RdoA (MazF antagonist)
LWVIWPTALKACGLPDTLVHGDLHPGDVRGTERTITLLDCGDSGIGHRMLDQPAFLAGLRQSMWRRIKGHWERAWLARLPTCEPAPAASLYQRFLDNIEPSEQVYHRNDPADWLRRTAALIAAKS